MYDVAGGDDRRGKGLGGGKNSPLGVLECELCVKVMHYVAGGGWQEG